jgi:hypothetical protein
MWLHVDIMLTDVPLKRLHIPEDCIIHSHHRENLKSYIVL